MLIISVCILLRAPTADVPYVPNAKYFAHLAHQTPFDPIYQMCHISYFLQHATVQVQIFHGTEPVWHMFYCFFYSSFSLIYSSVSPSTPILSSISHPNPLLSNPNPYCSSTPTPTPTPISL